MWVKITVYVTGNTRLGSGTAARKVTRNQTKTARKWTRVPPLVVDPVSRIAVARKHVMRLITGVGG